MIDVVLEIDNCYTEHGTVQTTVQTQIEEPPTDTDSDEYQDWEQDEIFQHTGAGLSGDAGYFVTVIASSRADLIPVGTTYEFI